jgi:hypothetical protein
VEFRFHSFTCHSIEHATVIKNITIRSFLNSPFPDKTTQYYEKSENTKNWVLPVKAAHLPQKISGILAVSLSGFRNKFCMGPGSLQLIQTKEWVYSRAQNQNLSDDKNIPCKVFTAFREGRRPSVSTSIRCAKSRATKQKRAFPQFRFLR